MPSDQQSDRLRLVIDPDQHSEPNEPRFDARGAKRIVGDRDASVRTHHFGGVGPAVELTDIADQDDTDIDPNDEADAAPRSRLWPFAMATLATLGFAGIIWYAYNAGVGTLPPEELPFIKAEPGPVKTRPDDPGGLDVPYQENLALNEVEPDPAAPQVERLLPPPETPMAPPATQSTAPAAEPAQETSAVPPAPTTAPAPAVTVPEAPVKAPAAAQPAAQPAVKSTAAPSGEFVLQLASLKAKERAPVEWARLQESFPSLLGGRELVVLPIDLGSRGIFYRIQAGYFSDRDSADAACAQLRAKRQDCLVTKR